MPRSAVGFVLRRLAYQGVVLVGVAFLVHVLILLSADPAQALLPPTTSPEAVEAFRRAQGWDQPLPVQFATFLGRAVQGDFGTSIRFGQPALAVVLERVPATLTLGLTGLAVGLAIAFPLGSLAALRRGTWADGAVRGFAVLGASVPGFVLGQVLILVVAVGLRALPVSGGGSVAHLVLPGLVVGIASTPGLIRILRASLLEVYGRDYIRTAFAKGLSPRAVLLRHALRNAAIPVVSFLAFDIAALLSGVVIVERVFAYPGMGSLAVQAISGRDLPVIQAFVFVAALTIVTTNLLLDVAYTRLDPRIRGRR
ncbi:MAG: ABC transporter permease [Chloroflexota bacterium]